MATFQFLLKVQLEILSALGNWATSALPIHHCMNDLQTIKPCGLEFDSV